MYMYVCVLGTSLILRSPRAKNFYTNTATKRNGFIFFSGNPSSRRNILSAAYKAILIKLFVEIRPWFSFQENRQKNVDKF